MVAAIFTSAAFLTTYLIYHFVFNLHTHYAGPKIFYWPYLVILLTHTVLAMAVLPLVLMTTFQALRAQKEDPTLSSPELSARFARHRKIARWTFPIWLYVSVTGVIVYLILYQLPKWAS
jgi:uncharacterized membrane protein YozB (DUF420 family)